MRRAQPVSIRAFAVGLGLAAATATSLAASSTNARAADVSELTSIPPTKPIIGGDPTELTRSANVQLTASHGVNMVLTDPRVNFIESLEAILVAELADNECWRTLADLARLADQPDLAEQCEGALLTEQEHLEKVRRWLAVGQGRPEPEFEVDVTVEDDGSAGDGGDGAAKSRKRSRSGSAGKSSKSRGK